MLVDKKRLISFFLAIVNVVLGFMMSAMFQKDADKMMAVGAGIGAAVVGLWTVWNPDYDSGEGTWGFSTGSWVPTPPIFKLVLGWIFLLFLPAVWLYFEFLATKQ